MSAPREPLEPLEPDYDPHTLRESYPDADEAQARIALLRADIRDAAADADETAELLARGDLVDLLRGTGALDEALAEALAAADRADLAGSLPQQVLARLRLAAVHQVRGDFSESTVLLTELTSGSAALGPAIGALIHQRAGENDFDQHHWADAREHFAAALELREAIGSPDGEIERTRTALAAATTREQGAP